MGILQGEHIVPQGADDGRTGREQILRIGRRAGDGEQLQRRGRIVLQRGCDRGNVGGEPLRAHRVRHVDRAAGNHPGEEVVEDHAEIAEIVDLPGEVAHRTAGRHRAVDDIGVPLGGEGSHQSPFGHPDDERPRPDRAGTAAAPRRSAARRPPRPGRRRGRSPGSWWWRRRSPGRSRSRRRAARRRDRRGWPAARRPGRTRGRRSRDRRSSWQGSRRGTARRWRTGRVLASCRHGLAVVAVGRRHVVAAASRQREDGDGPERGDTCHRGDHRNQPVKGVAR